MPACHRDRCVSLDIGKKNMGMFVGNMRRRSIVRWRKINIFDSEYSDPGKKKTLMRTRAQRFVQRMPRASTVLIEQQFQKNRSACNLQKELQNALGCCEGVSVVIIEPSDVRRWFNLEKGKRKKKVSAVEVADDIVAEGTRIMYCTEQATADVAEFRACKKRDDYADAMLQWLYALEAGVIAPAHAEQPSKDDVIIVDE